MLVGNNIVLVLITLFMSQLIEPLLLPYLNEGSLVLLLTVTLFITLVVLIFGEFLPKTFSQLYSNEYLYRSAFLLSGFYVVVVCPHLDFDRRIQLHHT